MKITLRLDYKELLAALLFASTDSTRYILNGVAIVLAPRKGQVATLVATDGRRMACINANCDVVEGSLPDQPYTAIIPAKLIKALRPAGKDPYLLTLESLDPAEDFFKTLQCQLTASTVKDGISVKMKSVDGKYPNWQQCFPANFRIGPSALHFNAQYMSEMCAAAKLLYPRCPHVTLASEGPDRPLVASISGVKNFVGLIMPVRSDELPNLEVTLPLFVRSEPVPVAPAAPVEIVDQPAIAPAQMVEAST